MQSDREAGATATAVLLNQQAVFDSLSYGTGIRVYDENYYFSSFLPLSGYCARVGLGRGWCLREAVGIQEGQYLDPVLPIYKYANPVEV